MSWRGPALLSPLFSFSLSLAGARWVAGGGGGRGLDTCGKSGVRGAGREGDTGSNTGTLVLMMVV